MIIFGYVLKYQTIHDNGDGIRAEDLVDSLHEEINIEIDKWNSAIFDR